MDTIESDAAAETGEQLEAQQEALRAGAHEERTRLEEERSALEQRAAELGGALDEVRARLGASETRAASTDQLAARLQLERDAAGTPCHILYLNGLTTCNFSIDYLRTRKITNIILFPMTNDFI